jgi:hypothetical protein
MRLVPKPGGTKQQFRALLFSQPFDRSFAQTAQPIPADGWLAGARPRGWVAGTRPRGWVAGKH